jgi:Leucine-rich repeat (LRR) protein
LVRLDASKNEIKEILMFSEQDKFKYLQLLNLSTNKIKELPEMNIENLIDLNLQENLIENTINFKGLPKVVKLNLKQNRLKDCLNLANMPKLIVLYLVKIKLI